MYAIKPEMLGHLEQEEVEAIHMSRARFLELVEETFSKMDLPESRDADLRAELLPVASKMPTFPIGTWLSASRGCGCVVGEYLIARKQIDQHNAVLDELAARKATVEEYLSRSRETSIEAMLEEVPNGGDLLKFGNWIDRAVRCELAAHEVYVEDVYEQRPDDSESSRQVVVVIDD